MILAVDLAAKFSAACLMGASGDVIEEWHSWGHPGFECSFVPYFRLQEPPEVLLVEDLPFNMRISKTVRDVYRLQGKIIHLMDFVDQADKIVFVPPMLWQSYFKPLGMKPGDKKAAKQIALEEYGYSSPELLHKDLHGKDRQHARKSMEDHVDAFLIARYMKEQADTHGSVDAAVEAVPRLERYCGD